jgi:hypothetical protein
LRQTHALTIIADMKAATDKRLSEPAWQVFTLEELTARVAGSEPRFLEFLRVPGISAAVLPTACRGEGHAGAASGGTKSISSPKAVPDCVSANRNTMYGRGTILFVRATAEHSFFDVQEDLTLLAFFGTSGPLWEP